MVQNSQPPEPISDPTVAKLLEVDSDLAMTEAVLIAQLESLQEKRRSLKNVIGLFTQADTTTATSVAALAVAQSNGASIAVKPSNEFVATKDLVLPVTEAQDSLLLETEQNNATTDSTKATESVESHKEKKTLTATKTKQPATTKKTATTPEPTTSDPTSKAESNQSPKAKSVSSASKTKQPTAAKKTAKTSGRWQDYLREEFSNSALSEAVGQVLQRQPEEVLETAAIIDAIFVDNLTKGVLNTARERMANVLSDGVRKNKWYRAEAGSYSMSLGVADEAKEAD